LELFRPRSGEHECAAYNEDHKEIKNNEQTLFYKKRDGRIQSFWRLPSNHEIINIDIHIASFKEANMPMLFNYGLGGSQVGSG